MIIYNEIGIRKIIQTFGAKAIHENKETMPLPLPHRYWFFVFISFVMKKDIERRLGISADKVSCF